MDVAAKHGIVDKLLFLYALQRIHKGLMKHVSGVRDLFSLVKRADVSDIPVVLPIFRTITGVVSCTPNRAADGPMESEEAQAPKEPEVLSAPVNFKLQMQLMVNERHERVQTVDILFY